MTMKILQLKTYGSHQKQFKREVDSNTNVHQETEKTLNTQSNFTPKTTRTRRKTATTKNAYKIRLLNSLKKINHSGGIFPQG